ncbi:MAG TPA: phosphatase PAP2 family protein [Candidatus Acidoferrales bacterium]|nr:phosphatase PAP2 family protein [Candidatus Acidoferrales bacterium]
MFDLSRLRPLDRLNVLGVFGISVTAIVFHSRVPYAVWIVMVNLVVSISILLLANLDSSRKNALIRFAARWYTFPLIFVTFKELYLMVHQINPHDLDYLLIRIDKAIFGADPTSLLDRIATPGLTEFLQICYSSFYLLWIILGVDLLLNKNEKGFLFFLFVLMYGFYTSYIGYVLVPAVGPRFTLYNFANINGELPGLYLTTFLRGVINSGESITNVAQAMMLAQRDCFPSGHTEMTIITIAIAMKYKAKSAMVITPLGLGVIFATVYMRYHYGIDVIAGAILAVFVLSTATWLESKLKSDRSDESVDNTHPGMINEKEEEVSSTEKRTTATTQNCR